MTGNEYLVSLCENRHYKEPEMTKTKLLALLRAIISNSILHATLYSKELTHALAVYGSEQLNITLKDLPKRMEIKTFAVGDIVLANNTNKQALGLYGSGSFTVTGIGFNGHEDCLHIRGEDCSYFAVASDFVAMH